MRKTLQSDVTNATTSYADVTGLSFPVTASRTYRFRFVVDYTCNATTTGSSWSINGPTSPTRLSFRAEYSLTTTSRTTLEGCSAYDTNAANASSAATGANHAIVEGFITPSADGTVVLRFISEVAVASAIVAKAGSTVDYFEVK